MICKISNPSLVSPLFQDWDETMIWSCLDGTMGELYGDDFKNPKSAAAVLGDFTFFAGVPSARSLERCIILPFCRRIIGSWFPGPVNGKISS